MLSIKAIGKFLCLLKSYSLPNNKSLDLTKLKISADNKLNVTQMLQFVFDRVETIWEKTENGSYQRFTPFSTMFSAGFSPRVIKTCQCAVRYQQTLL